MILEIFEEVLYFACVDSSAMECQRTDASAYQSCARWLERSDLRRMELRLILFIREVRRRFREGADDTSTYWLRVGAVTFRAVNIGLVNEIALMCDRMGINVWEVVNAAKTKPFGFMPFYPGP